jgi:thymidylate synthase
MSGPVYRNISFATIAGLRDLMRTGVVVDVRGSRIRELRNRLTVLERPRERCLFLPRRGNNVVASLAETLWVIAGRDDIGWLSAYLPRVSEFSDDGTTWRAAYGPRLRSWSGVDQLAATRGLLLEDASTRRAAMALYDPGRDFVQSKDIPCNNWLHWLVREGRLHLTIGVRSNDVMWGFSGVNSFEWSILQDMMAFWIGAEMGDVTYLATSFHLYAHHDERARKVVMLHRRARYDFGLTAPKFSTAFDQVDSVLFGVVRLEPVRQSSRGRRGASGRPFAGGFSEIMRLHRHEPGWSARRLAEGWLACEADLAPAAYGLYSRRGGATKSPDSRIAAWQPPRKGRLSAGH